MALMNNKSEIKRLSPSDATRMFSGMSPLQATRYYNKAMTNPNSPEENLRIIRQYREQNPQKFLSEDQMRGNRGQRGSWMYGKGYGRGYGGQYRQGGRVYGDDGFTYDQYGNRYDNCGNMTGGYQDGGSEPFQGYGDGNGFSDYYGAAYQRPRRDGRTYVDGRMPVGMVDISGLTGPSVKRLTFGYLDSRLKRVPVDQRQAYANKVPANDRAPQVNRDTMVAYILSHERMFEPSAYLDDHGSEEYDRLARVRNGAAADPGFVERIRRAFGCR